ncbi:hypothetical protein [Cumulibacter soli]|uniref:hypothetical protein n=1 Tax=Cumulibacter soli TaxID=2546344 RepID=UPI0010677B77|nr:hypothetical protein [Cumulibacter soli]
MTTARELRDVLVVTTDDDITRRSQRVIAAAGMNPVVRAPAGAVSRWRESDAVLVGVDALDGVLREDPPRRDSVYVVATEEIPTGAWRDCVSLGVSDAVTFVESEGWLTERLTLRSTDSDAGLTVRVMGSTGGCGASVTAAGLALAGGDDGAVLLDTNLRSGWDDLLLGLDPDGLGWAELSNLRGRVSGQALTSSIPSRDGISLIAANREHPQRELPADALRSAVLAASGLGSLVIVDEHIASGLIDTAAQLSDVTVLVTVSDVRGGLATRAALEALRGEPAGGASERSVPERGIPGRSGAPIVVAARTVRGAALPDATFAELTDLADDVFWLRESSGIDRRVAKGRAGLVGSERFVMDCAALLQRCRDLVSAR